MPDVNPADAVNPSATDWEDAVQPVHEEPSELVAEQKGRWAYAETDYATPQERRQAAVEKADAARTSFDGAPGHVHATEEPTLAVADETRVRQIKEDQERALGELEGSAPVGSPARREADDEAAQQRTAEAQRLTPGASTKAEQQTGDDRAKPPDQQAKAEQPSRAARR